MTLPLQTLLHAPWGSPELLDAVINTMDTIDDREFAAIIRERERIHGRGIPPYSPPPWLDVPKPINYGRRGVGRLAERIVSTLPTGHGGGRE